MNNQIPPLDDAWTVIAHRPRTTKGIDDLLTWQHLPDAPLTIREAHKLAKKGLLVMANRNSAERVELVIRPNLNAASQPD